MLIGLICPSQQTQDLQDLKFCYFLKVKPQLGSPTMTDQTLALQVTSLDQQHQPHPGLVRRAPSRAPAQICCIRTAGGGARQSVNRPASWCSSVKAKSAHSRPSLCDPMDRGACPWYTPGKDAGSEVVIPFSRGSSRPKDRSRLSCIAGRFFTI